MTREILFKAKRKDNGEWYFGSLIKTESVLDSSKYYYYIEDEYGDRFEVIPETVSQYTGLNDESGEKIFENDIVYYNDFTSVYKNDITGVVKYTQDCMFEIEYDDKYVRGEKTTRPLVCHEHSTFASKKIKIIGNIFDEEVKQC